ncbi:HAMP domain-containing sensor histidine kinase [Methylibium sp.]|uniref:HAMP domain-containing sensor histidine kinase n=1 Tax=Methylibium sp. TaxID=2067992 RepID=UPI0017ACDCA8|nr:HAMP domain-containing sensor histidine kinase [Methylibium sp.]MBA3588137.1 HAMP domain-containing histidine kinase [Methylibium sp.]
MRTLYLRIYLTVVALLLLFALVAGWLLQHNIEAERERFRDNATERVTAWGELIRNALPPPTAPPEQQAQALLDWSDRLRLPLALDDEQGRRIAAAADYPRSDGVQGAPGNAPDAGTAEEDADSRREAAVAALGQRPPQRVELSDGRVLWVVRPYRTRSSARAAQRGLLGDPPAFIRGTGLVVTLVLLFVAVAAGAYPVVRRLTRRLEVLKQGVETFGAGALHHRVDASGKDEVAAVAASFNQAAARVESLVLANRSLLANASHELRSPLARMKMAVEMLDGAAGAQRAPLKAEIERNIRELDQLVEEVLLASRLDARHERSPDGVDERVREAVDLIALAAEEAARVNATLDLPEAPLAPPAEPLATPLAPANGGGAPLPDTLSGDERLLRRALRNLLENACRYGGAGAPELQMRRAGDLLELRVLDRGPGVPEAQRERIFEPFYRLPGHAEQAGGVGLGLSLVRQIARHHGGEARCEAREGGGSCFVISLPVE